MIRRVLVNLCDNAARAVAGDGGRVTITARAPEGESRCVLEVADDGPGIPAQLRERIFEPYVTTARPGEGMGLGLAIARKILLEHGGDLELVPSAAGSAFLLALPRRVM